MSHQRFIAPPRNQVPAGLFRHPVFAEFSAFSDLLEGSQWPQIDQLNARFGMRDAPRFVTQTEALLADGLHYEARIHQHGLIATRPENWHDLFNALVWLRYAAIKRALNARQMADIERYGPRQRSRAQYALTQFDESGLLVWIKHAHLLSAWDRHDWGAWFGQHDAFDRGDIRVHVFGHALLERALRPDHLPTGKCLVLCGGEPDDWAHVMARAIADGTVLNDPQELRPLPLCGLPGWSAGQHAPDFYEGSRFRPLRPGRSYPPPVSSTL